MVAEHVDKGASAAFHRVKHEIELFRVPLMRQVTQGNMEICIPFQKLAKHGGECFVSCCLHFFRAVRHP